MFETLREILETAVQHLGTMAWRYGPPLLAAVTIGLVALLVAACSRWLVNRLFKGVAFDRFLDHSGLLAMLDRSGRLRAKRLVSGAVFWLLFGAGMLTALNAFNTDLSTQMINSVVFLMPKLATAGLILLGGVWLAHYLAFSTLVWASNENIPYARRWAAGVRIVIVFVAVVVTADYLNFARSVFLAAFIILVGGAVLAVSIAGGFAALDALRRQAGNGMTREPERDSLWNHL